MSHARPNRRVPAVSGTAPALRGGAALLLAFAWASALGLAFGCNDEQPPAQPARFNRPNRVDFVCVDGATVLPRASCEKSRSDNHLALNALVTQAGRGEVAVVDLRAHRVLDSRRDIPGYTFVPVGEMPTAIVVPPVHAGHTYVADFGSRDVRVLRTRALVSTVLESPDAQTVSLTAADGVTLLAPTDMVLAPDESALFVAIPDAGQVLRLPLLRCDENSASDCEDGLIDESAISALDVKECAATAAPGPASADRYEQLCDYERAALPAATPIALDADALKVAPRPIALGLDAFCPTGETCTQRLLVADNAQPVIHALDIDAWAVGGAAPCLPSLVTGVPTTAVAVTPRVPRNADGEGETQYVYAIDAHDGSVLVLEDGQVLNVNGNPGQRADRLSFSAGAQGVTALEVVTPAFDVHGPAAQYVNPSTDEPVALPLDNDPVTVRNIGDRACTDEDHDEETPARLRGVFLTAALTDGTVRVVDVHDMELRTSDGSAEACRSCSAQSIPVLVRNQERLATSFVPVEGEDPPSFVPAVTAFLFYVDGVSFSVRTDGSSASPRVPGLACLACDEGLTRVFPADSSSASVQPTTSMDAGVATVDGGELGELGKDGGELPIGDAAPVPQEDESSILNPSCTGDTPALLCVANDPWFSGADVWSAIYEGVVPATQDSHGRFVPPGADGNESGGLEIVAARDFCAAGVLGEEDMGPDYGDCAQPANLVGDQLVVTARPLGRERLSQLKRGDSDVLDACAELSAALDADSKLFVAFEIRRAYSDRLVVQSTLLQSIGDAKRFEDIAACYQDAISFEVRSLRAFTVVGAASGFQHHVRANGAGRCQVDPEGDPLMIGRARLGCMYRNHSLQFQLRGQDANDSVAAQPIGVGLQAGFTSRANKVTFRAYDLGFGNATVVPVQLRYSDVDRKLYLLDINERGLVPIPVDPFPPVLSSAGQYN